MRRKQTKREPRVMDKEFWKRRPLAYWSSNKRNKTLCNRIMRRTEKVHEHEDE